VASPDRGGWRTNRSYAGIVLFGLIIAGLIVYTVFHALAVDEAVA
jgi:hypothetical protein